MSLRETRRERGRVCTSFELNTHLIMQMDHGAEARAKVALRSIQFSESGNDSASL